MIPPKPKFTPSVRKPAVCWWCNDPNCSFPFPTTPCFYYDREKHPGNADRDQYSKEYYDWWDRRDEWLLDYGDIHPDHRAILSDQREYQRRKKLGLPQKPLNELWPNRKETEG